MSFFNPEKKLYFFHVWSCARNVSRFFCPFATLDVNVNYETMSNAFKIACNLMMMIAVAASVAQRYICVFLVLSQSALRFTIALYLKLREISTAIACMHIRGHITNEQQKINNAI